MMVLIENECSLSGGDTQPLLAVKKIKLFALSGGGGPKTLGTSPCTCVNEPPGETFIA